MFSGDDRISIASTLSEDDFYTKVEDALSALGRARVSKSGSITVEAKEGLKSFLSNVNLDGSIRKKSDGYDVSVSYSLSPTTANWVIAVILLCVFFPGAAIILFPLFEKDKVAKAVTNALNDLEDTVAPK